MSASQIIFLIITTHLLAVISPGPDFAIVVRNAISYPRNLALMTAIGVGAGIFMHTTYCAIGLTFILVKYPLLFKWIRYLGGCYLLYLGAKITFSKAGVFTPRAIEVEKQLSALAIFRQGFFVNALNPKAIFFILSLFILVEKLNSIAWSIFFVFEMTLVTMLWFILVVLAITHPAVKGRLIHSQRWISKILGLFVFCFGLQLFWN